MWAPPVISWFINPINYSYLSTINNSYWSYWHQLSYRTGAPHCTIHTALAPCPTYYPLSAQKCGVWLQRMQWWRQLKRAMCGWQETLQAPVVMPNLGMAYGKNAIFMVILSGDFGDGLRKEIDGYPKSP